MSCIKPGKISSLKTSEIFVSSSLLVYNIIIICGLINLCLNVHNVT